MRCLSCSSYSVCCFVTLLPYSLLSSSSFIGAGGSPSAIAHTHTSVARERNTRGDTIGFGARSFHRFDVLREAYLTSNRARVRGNSIDRPRTPKTLTQEGKFCTPNGTRSAPLPSSRCRRSCKVFGGRCAAAYLFEPFGAR
jgi:hypothetical protein